MPTTVIAVQLKRNARGPLSAWIQFTLKNIVCSKVPKSSTTSCDIIASGFWRVKTWQLLFATLEGELHHVKVQLFCICLTLYIVESVHISAPLITVRLHYGTWMASLSVILRCNVSTRQWPLPGNEIAGLQRFFFRKSQIVISIYAIIYNSALYYLVQVKTIWS